MAKYGADKGKKANFLGTCSDFPSPTENQGSDTNKGSVSKARNEKGTQIFKASPLTGYGEDSRAQVGDLESKSNRWAMGEGNLGQLDARRSSSSFGPADRSYKKGQ